MDTEAMTRPELTGRQRQVVALLAEGITSKEIARLLGISIHTVKVHISVAMGRAGVHTQAGLVGYQLRRDMAETLADRDESRLS